MLCHYWYFEDVGFKFEENVCNGWHDLLTMAYVSENIAILSTKRATFRCILWGISRNEGLRRLNILWQKIKASCKMGFRANKTPIEVI